MGVLVWRYRENEVRRALLGAINLVRPYSLIGIMLGGVASVRLTASAWSPVQAWSILIGLALISAGGYADNDVCDVSIDAINRPRRPLITGALSVLAAKRIAVATFLSGIFALTFVSIEAFAGGVLAVLLLLAYSRIVKRRWGLAGNLLIALLLAIPALLAMWHAHDMRPVAFAVLVAGLMFAREVLKDLEDRIGDYQGGRRTIALSGKTWPVRIAVAFGVLIGVCAGSFHLALADRAAALIVRWALDSVVLGFAVAWIVGWIPDVLLKQLLKYGLFGYCVLLILSGV